MTNVVVDAAALAGAPANRGVGTYVRELLRGVARLGEVSVVALAPEHAPVPDGVAVARTSRRAPGRIAFAEHEVRLPFDLRRVPSDVVHAAGGHPPARSPAPVVVTLFDVIPLEQPDETMRAAVRRWRLVAARYRSATGVVAISRYAADSGRRTLGLAGHRVHVVPLAAAAHFRPLPEGDRWADPPYLLLVGEYEPRKRFEHAFAVVAALAERGFPHRLRIAGSVPRWRAAALDRAVARAPRPDRIDVLGHVDDLAGQYQQASALIHPSRAEGFGLPLVESMACATPVIAYANTAVPEVVGDGGFLVDDGDVGALARVALALVGNDAAWREASERALARAAAFSWDRTARDHAEIYRAAAR